MEVLKGIRDAFGQAMLELGAEDKSVFAVVSDSKFSSKLDAFEKKFPGRLFEVGIAEQNLIGIAAGLAASGKTVFACAIANFATMRCFEQIRNDVAFPNMNVKIVAMSAGFSYPYLGATHTCLEDIAIMRAIPNLTVVIPADTVEVVKAVRAIARYKGPVFLRLGRQPVPDIFSDDYEFQIGKAVVLKDGSDLTIISAGAMVHLCLEAHEVLARKNINARIINLSTVKPIDRDTLVKAAKETGCIITVEEHNLWGGLGSAVSEALCDNHPVPIRRIGIPNEFPAPGTRTGLLERYGLTVDNIVKVAEASVSRKIL